MMHTRRPMQEEHSKPRGKPALAGGLALLLIAISMAFQFYLQSRIESDQLGRVQTLMDEMRAELDKFAEQRINYETQIASLNRELRASQETAAAQNNELALAQEQISPDLSRIEQQIRQRVIREVERQHQENALPTPTRILKQLASLEQEELREIMSLQSNYGGFLQALDVSDQRMEEIVDALTNQIAENNRARREIIEENVGNPEGRRSIRRSFSPSTPLRLSERPFPIFWMRQNWQCSTVSRRSASSSVRCPAPVFSVARAVVQALLCSMRVLQRDRMDRSKPKS